MANSSTTINRKMVLLVICLAAFLVPFMGSSLNLALPHISREFTLNATSMGWVVTVYLLSAAIFQVPFGRLADMFNPRQIFIGGLILLSVASFFCGFTSNAGFLIAFRAMQGVGSAMIFSTNMAILTATFAAQERGKILGINTAVVYLAAATGPFLGGIFTDYLGWRSIFIIVASIAVIVGLASCKILPKTANPSKKEKFDAVGAFIYGISLFTFIYGFSILPSTLGFILLVTGIILLVVFVRYEKTKTSPVFNVHVFFSNKVFFLSSVAAFINYSATFGIGFLLSLYLQYVKGFDARHAGMILIAQPLIQTVFSPLAGRLSDKWQARYLASGGMAIISVVLLLLCFVTAETPIYLLIMMLLLLGIGFAFFSSPNVNSIMGSVESRYYGMASATTGTMRLAGQAFSMGLTMMVISLYLSNQPMSVELNAEFISAMKTAFLIFSILCAVGVLASMSRNHKNRVSK